MEQTYKSGEEFQDVKYDKRDAVFLYKGRKMPFFSRRKRKNSLPLETLSDKMPYLKENTELEMMFAEDRLIMLLKSQFKVVMAPPSMKRKYCRISYENSNSRNWFRNSSSDL